MPPSKCPDTTIGFSNHVTVHMPSKAWKHTTASASTAMRRQPDPRQKIATPSSNASPSAATTLDDT